ILNILFIRGLSAAIRRLPLPMLSLRLDVPVMIAAAVGLILMSWNGVISRIEGMVLVAGAILYLIALMRLSKRETAAMRREYAEEYGERVLIRKRGRFVVLAKLGILLVGMALTIWGAELLVDGAVQMAQRMGVSDAVIGLTIVAIGTSAPELVTTMVATWKDDREVAVGNLIGSSISNILVILGLTCVAAPGGVDVSTEILRIDLPLAAAVAVVCYPVFRSDRMVSRTEGVIFVMAYLVYLATLVTIRT